VASWNSTDMTYKKSADMKEQAKKLNDLNDVKAKAGYIDSLLKGNQTILQISNYQLEKLKHGNADLAKEIKDTAGHLEQAEKDKSEKKNALDESTKKTKETADAVAEAQKDISEAQTSVEAKRKADNTASANEQRAEDNLERTVIEHPQDAEAANRTVELKKQELAIADKALDEAIKKQAAMQKALSSARAAASSASKELSEATSDYQDSVGKVEGLQKMLYDLKNQDADPMKRIQAVQHSINKLQAIVHSLGNQSKDLHETIVLKTKAHEEISATVDKDTECIASLQQDEAKLNLSTYRFNLSAVAYEAASEGDKAQLLGALWTIKDEMIADTRNYIGDLEKCAPKGVKVPPQIHPPKCSTDTLGSCWILPCHESRHATCSSDSKCVCPAGTCAQHGVCVQRPSPLLLASPPAEPPAQPAAAGLVLVSAAALAATALLAARRRRAPEIRMPVDVLG